MSLAECLPGVSEGFGFDAAVQRGQVGCLLGRDGDHDLWVAGVADDPALNILNVVVGSDFPGEGAGEGNGLQHGGALFLCCRGW